MNASDVRSGSDLQQIIKNALEMNELNQAGNKPTCLIVDEVDGALGGGDGDQARGLKQVADFLQKCIRASKTQKKKSETSDDNSDAEMKDEPI